MRTPLLLLGSASRLTPCTCRTGSQSPPPPTLSPPPLPQPASRSAGDVIFARLRRPSDDSLAALLHPRRRRHPLATAFRTVDARSYSEIATVDVERAVLDLALDPTDSYLAVVSVDIGADTATVSSAARTFEVGRPRPALDDESDGGGDGEEDEEEVRHRVPRVCVQVPADKCVCVRGRVEAGPRDGEISGLGAWGGGLRAMVWPKGAAAECACLPWAAPPPPNVVRAPHGARCQRASADRAARPNTPLPPQA